MLKKAVVLTTLIIILVGCQANPSAFSPDIATTVEPSSANPVNVSDNDVNVTVTNKGQINAYDVKISIEANGQTVEETVAKDISSGEEETMRFTKGEALTEFCTDQENTMTASATPSVKDLNPENNDDSQRITC